MRFQEVKKIICQCDLHKNMVWLMSTIYGILYPSILLLVIILMNYFANHYKDISYPDAEDGLRNAQIGAIHAIGAHFSLHTKVPALIVLPTGTGKTAVLIMSAFLMKAKKVLVISSSILVRGQIVQEFSELTTLKRLKVVEAKIEGPKVKEVSSPIKTIEDWSELVMYDVVVGIPTSLFGSIENGILPPTDLFDVILVDEAHHAPAKTWEGLLNYFTLAKKILFTATPFRRDKKEIPGKLIYNYPLAKAKEDKVFGKIGYLPISPSVGETEDIAIAKATENVFKKDREAGFNHYILIRTEKKKHAKELLKIYQENTSLNVCKIDSSQSFAYIQGKIKALKEKRLDGIICVNMLGEGFDFPNLKIAAIHAPHKSLAVTLQFIGRFARTNAHDIGQAKFLASPNIIALGKHQLYQEGAIWDEIVVNLSHERIEKEDETKSMVDSFSSSEAVADECDKFSLYNINPFFHVKIYRVEDFNINAVLQISGHEIEYHFISEENLSVVYITKEIKKPKWLNSDDLINVQFYIFMIYYYEEEGLLFLHSSIRTTQFYDNLIANFSSSYTRIPKADINKVLANIKDIDFFNIGMQNRSASSGESYKTITGSSAQNVIKKSDGRMYSNGHIYARGKDEDDKPLTIGYSSGSKIWSNAYLKVNEYIGFCKVLGKKINSDAIVRTNTGFDNLPIGKIVTEFPHAVYAVTWDHRTFVNHPIINVCKDDEVISKYQLLDFDIINLPNESTSEKIILQLKHDDLIIPLSYSFKDHFNLLEETDTIYMVEETDLITYLNECSLKFFLIDFSMIHHHEWHQTPNEGELHYDADFITVFDWKGYNVDITKEFYKSEEEKIDNGSKESIHEGLNAYLHKIDLDIIVYDHGPGEIADFITLKENDGSIDIEFYHAKKSGGNDEGDRVNDVYDVCGQANKSLVWTTNKPTFLTKLANRVEGKEDTKFLKGTLDDCRKILSKAKILKFVIHVVQPGITKAGLSEKISTVLASTHGYIQSNGSNERFSIIASN